MTLKPTSLQIGDKILCEKDGAMVLAEVKEVVMSPKKYLHLVTNDLEQTHFKFYFDDSTRVDLMTENEIIIATAVSKTIPPYDYN